MKNLGVSEIVLMLVVVALLLGAKRLPSVGKRLGESLGLSKTPAGALIFLLTCVVALFVAVWPLASAIYGDAYALSLLVGVLVAVLVFGGLGVWVASVKHRSSSEGALLGGLLGPLGVIIEALLPSQLMSAPQKAMMPELTRTCPECAETIKAEARLCRFCGTRISEDELPATVVGAGKGAAPARCSGCGAMVAPHNRFCETCGARVATAARCSECGATLSPENRFCESCGSRVRP